MSRRKKSKSRTLAVVIQDKSGSMADRAEATISGFNEYVDTLKEDKNSEILLTLTQFDTAIRELYTSIPLSEVPSLTRQSYVAGGMTALYDAVGKTVRSVEKTAKPNDKVLVIIMTDGGENSSRDYAQGAILDLFEKKRSHGWEFVFLGAGEESWNSGQSLGFKYGETVFYGNDPHDHAHTFRSMAKGTSFYGSVGKEGLEGTLGETKAGLETNSVKEMHWDSNVVADTSASTENWEKKRAEIEEEEAKNTKKNAVHKEKK